MNKDKWLIDLPVAINFFCRPDTLSRTFEKIRIAKPRQLFLIADGPREGNDTDIINCKRCRDLVENISWDCEVYRFYNETNKGLFVTYFESMERVFEVVNYCVFMEDDVVVSDSFFPYCLHLLQKYENDYRISFVTAVNIMPNGISSKIPYDYFFSGEGALTAYGLWKRTFDSMNMEFLKDEYAINAMKRIAKKMKPGYDKRIERYRSDLNWQGHMPHVEVYKNLLRFSQNQICIVPQKNLVTNIGVGSNATHSANDLRKLPKATQCIFEAESYEMQFPLKEPIYLVQDLEYENRVNYILAWNNNFLKFTRRIEALVRHIFFGDFGRILQRGKIIIKGKGNLD